MELQPEQLSRLSEKDALAIIAGLRLVASAANSNQLDSIGVVSGLMQELLENGAFSPSRTLLQRLLRRKTSPELLLEEESMTLKGETVCDFSGKRAFLPAARGVTEFTEKGQPRLYVGEDFIPLLERENTLMSVDYKPYRGKGRFWLSIHNINHSVPHNGDSKRIYPKLQTVLVPHSIRDNVCETIIGIDNGVASSPSYIRFSAPSTLTQSNTLEMTYMSPKSSISA